MRVVAFLTLTFVLGSCATQPATLSGSPAATPSNSAPATVEPSVRAPNATPTETDLIDELAAVVTDDLVVRSRPGTGSDSEIYAARLNAPLSVYVIAGPERADGYDWYLVDPLVMPCYLGCDLTPQAGWVAAAGKDGERWLAEERVPPRCPKPTLDEIAATYPELWPYCFGSRELMLEAVVGVEATDPPPGWPWSHRVALHEPGYEGPVYGCVDACDVPALVVAFEGDGDPPPAMSASRVIGHFNDVRAQECRSRDVDQRLERHSCQMVFVVTRWD